MATTDLAPDRNLARQRGFWSQMSLRSIAIKALLAALLPAAAPTGAAAAEPQIAPMAHYVNHFRITAAGDDLVGARARRTTADLRVATAAARPVRIAGIKPVPSWAMPHLGTDAQGDRVVVYPRCSHGRVSTCDLFSWNLDQQQESKLVDASQPATGETEGVLHRGELVFNRWTSRVDPVDAQLDVNVSTALFFQPLGGAVRSLGAGGQQLALTAGWVAQVRDTAGRTVDADGSLCGNSVVELVRTDGTRRVPVRSMPCGSIKSYQSPTFIGQSLIFGATGTDRHPNGLLYRYDRAAGRTFAARGPSSFDQFVATSDTAGYATWQADQLGGGTDVIRVSGLVYDREVTTPRAARKPTL